MANRAPGKLALVQDFVNTVDLEEGKEQIGTSEALRSWLVDRGLMPGRHVTAADHARAIELREALRRLLLANNGGDLHEVDLEVLNGAARDAGLRPRFLSDGHAILEPELAGTVGALGRIVASISDAMTDRTWSRLKACADQRCRWAFYDQSKNRSGHWCSMDVCGNRSKARQFRRRQSRLKG